MPRFQREQELEYYLSKQSNSLGLRIQNKLAAIDQQFSLQNTNQIMNESTNSISTNVTQQHQQSISSITQLPSANTSTSLTNTQEQ